MKERGAPGTPALGGHPWRSPGTFLKPKKTTKTTIKTDLLAGERIRHCGLSPATNQKNTHERY